MRNYIQKQAEYRAPHGLVGALNFRLTNWRLRREIRSLLHFEDYQLRDIGFTRQNLLYVLNRPSDCDLKWELEQLALDAQQFTDLANNARPNQNRSVGPSSYRQAMHPR